MPYVEGFPLIEAFETDLITREELAKAFGVGTTTVDKWRYGRDQYPQLPYFRLGRQMYFSKAQVTHWLDLVQRSPDVYFEDRKRRLKEGLNVGTKSVR